MQVVTSDRATRGILWAAVDKFGIVLLQFVINLVLARLLTPDDFGLVGMIMIVIAVSSILADGGFGAALIQKRDANEEDFSTAFYINIVVGTLLYLVVFLLSDSIALLLGNPILSKILRVMGVVIVINSVALVPKVTLRRSLSFNKIAIANIVSYTISATVAIVMAKLGYGLWGLVALYVVNSTLTTLLLSLFARWRPSLIFSRCSMKRLFAYGEYMLISDILSNICFNIQNTLVGKYFTPYTAGQYAQAKKMEEVASTTLPSAMQQVLFPVYSNSQDNISELRGQLRENSKMIAFIIFPLLTLLIIIARPLIVFLFGEQWMDSVFYFQMLCIAGFFTSLEHFNYFALAAIGKSRLLFGVGVLKSFVLIALLLVAVQFSIEMVLVAMIISNAINYMVNATLSHRYIGYKLSMQFADLIRYLIYSSLVAVMILLINSLLNMHWVVVALLFVVIYLSVNIIDKGSVSYELWCHIKSLSRGKK